ncbi:hypothetical protein BKA69DRAFT_202979 [Paraphysoderma sedebokerense]|nr:hypothetical protein BKA69DRAFT_202979 [Paraphysoderma sedebokerense]
MSQFPTPIHSPLPLSAHQQLQQQQQYNSQLQYQQQQQYNQNPTGQLNFNNSGLTGLNNGNQIKIKQEEPMYPSPQLDAGQYLTFQNLQMTNQSQPSAVQQQRTSAVPLSIPTVTRSNSASSINSVFPSPMASSPTFIDYMPSTPTAISTSVNSLNPMASNAININNKNSLLKTATTNLGLSMSLPTNMNQDWLNVVGNVNNQNQNVNGLAVNTASANLSATHGGAAGGFDMTVGSLPPSLSYAGSPILSMFDNDVESKDVVEQQKMKQRKRRESHNAIERRRRDNINERIYELYTLLPEMYLDNETVTQRPNKGTILKKSVDYLRQLQSALREQAEKIVELEQQLKGFGVNIEENESRMNADGENEKSRGQILKENVQSLLKLEQQHYSEWTFICRR